MTRSNRKKNHKRVKKLIKKLKDECCHAKKKTNSPTSHSTNDPIHSTKTFFTNQQGKNLPLIKETRHRKSHTKKTTGKKTVIVFHQIIEKKSSNELKNNLKSDKTLHNLPAHKSRSNHVQEKN